MSCISGGDLRCGRLPPCGGSGLKCCSNCEIELEDWSPSMRREWIEIRHIDVTSHHPTSPSMRREWIEMMIRTAD